MDGHSFIIETRGLCKAYTLGETSIPVLFDIDFTLKRGEFAAIMGPSGSGKSTLLNILGCLDTPGSGEYRLNNRLVNGRTESELADVRRHDIGFVFQNFNLLPKLNIAANVELPLIYDNVPAKTRKALVEETLRSLGLWERRHHRPNEISGGQNSAPPLRARL
ncbi:MAG: ABC transporter ATP-binding protein [Fibrobacterota bacterium]